MSLLQRVVGTAPRSSRLDCSSRKDPRRLENWVEQQRRPNCSYIAEYDFPDAMPNLDALVVTAMSGPAASLADLLRLDLHGPDFAKDSARATITHLVTRDHISTIKDLLGHKALRLSLCCTACFYEVVRRCSWSIETQGNALREYGDVFDFLIRELREDL
ncbi:hypothetical protein MAA_11789 [Metarhizium robertsii ARSEF 23]|uniref:Uncharacterized protein n=1 Tax=Metarhizium robertsii (strain ARSEF 23 / ATCC MYA-3075) TaxID=655844 RepID=A0A0B2XD14_METRA|nr:uncharacterized protein MAA_11789 [Metarhizium robertsii ARSEF 23]KHO10610.1 hypothetical protein MAA_11789 [Metarhizium robertsii ARSEF 23]